eukprot:Polyplicarium_translucidae@DN4747_c0_g1_i1.p1
MMGVSENPDLLHDGGAVQRFMANVKGRMLDLSQPAEQLLDSLEREEREVAYEAMLAEGGEKCALSRPVPPAVAMLLEQRPTRFSTPEPLQAALDGPSIVTAGEAAALLEALVVITEEACQRGAPLDFRVEFPVNSSGDLPVRNQPEAGAQAAAPLNAAAPAPAVAS